MTMEESMRTMKVGEAVRRPFCLASASHPRLTYVDQSTNPISSTGQPVLLGAVRKSIKVRFLLSTYACHLS